jgi:hypothetical protein
VRGPCVQTSNNRRRERGNSIERKLQGARDVLLLGKEMLPLGCRKKDGMKLERRHMHRLERMGRHTSRGNAEDYVRVLCTSLHGFEDGFPSLSHQYPSV